MSKKIILVSISSLFHDGRINTYIQKLNELGYKVFVISLKQDKNESRVEKNNSFINYKIAKRYIGNSKLGYIWFYLKFFFANFFLSTYLASRYNIKIIHYNNSPNFIIFSCLIPKLLRCKLILDIHDLVPATVQSKFNNKLLFTISLVEQELSMRFANQVLCADHNQYDYLKELKIKNLEITPILNIPSKSILEFKHNNNNNNSIKDFKLVYHGTISYRLGIDLVIKAIDLIRHDLKSFKFHLIGKGDFVESAKKIVTEKGLNDFVIIYDKYIPYNELPKLLSNMNAGVIGNRLELLSDYMLPVKLLEYVNFNIPVIAPRNKIICRYFSEDMICFYEPENIRELAEKILLLYQNSEVRYKYAELASSFTKRHNYDTEMFKYEEVIKKLN